MSLDYELDYEKITKGLDPKTKSLVNDACAKYLKFNLLDKNAPKFHEGVDDFRAWQKVIAKPAIDESVAARMKLVNYLNKKGVKIDEEKVYGIIYDLINDPKSERTKKAFNSAIIKPLSRKQNKTESSLLKQPKMTNAKLTKMSRCR